MVEAVRDVAAAGESCTKMLLLHEMAHIKLRKRKVKDVPRQRIPAWNATACAHRCLSGSVVMGAISETRLKDTHRVLAEQISGKFGRLVGCVPGCNSWRCGWGAGTPRGTSLTPPVVTHAQPGCSWGRQAPLFSGTWSARTRPEPTQGSWVGLISGVIFGVISGSIC